MYVEIRSNLQFRILPLTREFFDKIFYLCKIIPNSKYTSLYEIQLGVNTFLGLSLQFCKNFRKFRTDTTVVSIYVVRIQLKIGVENPLSNLD